MNKPQTFRDFFDSRYSFGPLSDQKIYFETLAECFFEYADEVMNPMISVASLSVSTVREMQDDDPHPLFVTVSRWPGCGERLELVLQGKVCPSEEYEILTSSKTGKLHVYKSDAVWADCCSAIVRFERGGVGVAE
jgi:hypothetical protein